MKHHSTLQKTNVLPFSKEKSEQSRLVAATPEIEANMVSITLGSDGLKAFGLIAGDALICNTDVNWSDIRPMQLCA